MNLVKNNKFCFLRRFFDADVGKWFHEGRRISGGCFCFFSERWESRIFPEGSEQRKRFNAVGVLIPLVLPKVCLNAHIATKYNRTVSTSGGILMF